MRRGAVVLAVVALFALLWRKVDSVAGLSPETRSDLKRQLLTALGVTLFAVFAALFLWRAKVVYSLIAAVIALVGTGVYNLVWYFWGPGAGSGSGGSGAGGGDAGLPDPCVVGPYFAGGRAYLCHQ